MDRDHLLAIAEELMNRIRDISDQRDDIYRRVKTLTDENDRLGATQERFGKAHAEIIKLVAFLDQNA